MKTRVVVATVLAALVGGAVPAPASDTASIYDNLVLMKEHSVLLVAVTETKEAATLKAAGPYTLFVPTDAAFKTLDEEAVKKLVTGKEAVRKLLRAHLAEGKITTKELADLKEVRTLQGGVLKVEKVKDGVRVGGAKIVAADVACSNGVIHVVDAVLPAKE